MELTTQIADRLKEEIIRHFKSIDGFAKALDMHPSSLRSNYLSGKSIPGGKWLYRFANLGLDINYILLGKRPKSNNEKIAELETIIHILKNDLKFAKSIIIKSRESASTINKILNDPSLNNFLEFSQDATIEELRRQHIAEHKMLINDEKSDYNNNPD